MQPFKPDPFLVSKVTISRKRLKRFQKFNCQIKKVEKDKILMIAKPPALLMILSLRFLLALS